MPTQKKKLEAKAKAVAEAAGVGFDPVTVVTIITALLGLFQNCNLSPAEAAAELKDPSRLTQLLIRRECRKHYAKKAKAEALASAVIAEGENVTASEVKAMLAEANG
jgi:hypothetical protein